MSNDRQDVTGPSMDMSDLADRIRKNEEEVTRLRRKYEDDNSERTADQLWKAEVKLNLATQDATLTKLMNCIEGNGEPGLKIRVDRIEESRRFEAMVRKVVTGFVIALLVSAIGAWITKLIG